MATLVHQCPHSGCLTDRMNFTIHQVSYGPGKRQNTFRNYLHTSCGACTQPVGFEVADQGGSGRLGPDFVNYPATLEQLGWRVINVWPESPKPNLPEHLPEAVAKAYLSAERNFAMAKMEEASAGSYGRALDVGTKLYGAERGIDQPTLFKRINALADKNSITRDLADWAHAIRSIRNDALHEADSISRDELVAIRGFSETVLTYLFTLPGMLKARQALTNEKPKR